MSNNSFTANLNNKQTNKKAKKQQKQQKKDIIHVPSKVHKTRHDTLMNNYPFQSTLDLQNMLCTSKKLWSTPNVSRWPDIA